MAGICSVASAITRALGTTPVTPAAGAGGTAVTVRHPVGRHR